MTDVPGPRRREVPLILLVEDHQDTRQMYAEFLGMGFEVVTAADGEQGLEAAQLHRPDLIITDLSLPGMDGFQLLARVREDDGLRALPIICLSGYGGQAHALRARAAGCDLILQKPCMPDELAQAATELIHEAASRGDR